MAKKKKSEQKWSDLKFRLKKTSLLLKTKNGYTFFSKKPQNTILHSMHADWIRSWVHNKSKNQNDNTYTQKNGAILCYFSQRTKTKDWPQYHNRNKTSPALFYLCTKSLCLKSSKQLCKCTNFNFFVTIWLQVMKMYLENV